MIFMKLAKDMDIVNNRIERELSIYMTMIFKTFTSSTETKIDYTDILSKNVNNGIKCSIVISVSLH
jgi:hypothetical protein